jgi:WD40 repeat protein
MATTVTAYANDSMPMALLSRASSTFITVSADNRINLWDTNTRKKKRDYIEKNHLNHVYNCCQWRQETRNSLGVFAAGCSDGTLVIWDFTRGIVTRTIETQSQLPISGVQFSNDGASLYVSSSDNYISVYGVHDGELQRSIKVGKKGISKVALNPKVEALAVAK